MRRGPGQTGGVTNGVEDLAGQARARLGHRPSPEEARAAQKQGALLVDIRPAAQRAEHGEIPGALIIERNVLEWRLDPRSDARLRSTPLRPGGDRHLPGGLPASLARPRCRTSACTSATDLDGGFKAWRAAGLPTDGAAPDVVALAEEVQAIGRAGLHFADGPLRPGALPAPGRPGGTVLRRDGPGRQPGASWRASPRRSGCITPKVGADAAIFDDEGRLLLVERADDRCWGLISGWVEPGEHPAQTRRAGGEGGGRPRHRRRATLRRRVPPARLQRDRPPLAWSPSSTGPRSSAARSPVQPHEVLAARWWPLDDVPAWHHDHETRRPPPPSTLTTWRVRRGRCGGRGRAG